MEYKDFAGRDISVGDYIAYAVRVGNSPELKLGRVTALIECAPNGYQTKSTPAIKATTINKYGRFGFELQKDGKAVTLSHMDRIIVVDMIPVEIADLINGKE